MLSLPHYARIKDNYCVLYSGNSKEYIVQLKLLRPIIERELPGIKVFIACRTDSMYLLAGEERIISKDDLAIKKANFAYIREINCDMQNHPVEQLMLESDLPCGPICKNSSSEGNCVLLTNGILPTKSLTGNQIQEAISYIKRQGFEPAINTNIEQAGWIIGVENEKLFQAAAQGKKTTLIPTGLGESLYKKMFPKGEILRLKE